MFYNHHAVKNDDLQLDEYALLRPTLFSNNQVLLGVNSDGTIVVRRDYHSSATLEGAANLLYARSHSVEGRREFHRYWDCITEAYAAAFHYQPQSGSSLSLLDEEPHEVTSWYFIGLDSTVEADISPAPLVGRFTLGNPLDETKLSTDGRMWFKWSCDPMQVTPSTQLHFGFADEAGNAYYKTVLGSVADLAERYTDTTSKTQKYTTEPYNVPSLTIPIDRLFGRNKTEQTIESQSNFASSFSQQLADQLMDTLYGADESRAANPFSSPPTTVATLWESPNVAYEFNTVMDGMAKPLPKLHYMPTNDGLGRIFASTAQYSKTAKTFTFPADLTTGVKISFRVSNRCSYDLGKRGESFSLKCHRDDQPTLEPHKKQSVLMLADHLHFAEAGFVGGYNPQEALYIISNSAALKDSIYATDGLEGFKAEGFSSELYEAYIMGDGHAYLYLNGEYLGRYITTPETVARGVEYTFSLMGYQTTVAFDELKVEAFSWPADYVAPTNKPDIYALAGWSGYAHYSRTPNLKPYMFDGELNYVRKAKYLHLYTNADYHVDFSVSAPLQLRAFSDYAQAIFDLINLATGETTEVTIERDSWGTISDNLTAGRWRLRGKSGYTILTQFEINPPVVPPEPEPEPTPE